MLMVRIYLTFESFDFRGVKEYGILPDRIKHGAAPVVGAFGRHD